MTSRSRRGPMRPRQATTFDNCHNQLRDVLHPILGLRAGRYVPAGAEQATLRGGRQAERKINSADLT